MVLRPSYFIYYRRGDGLSDSAARARVATLQAALLARCGTAGRLMHDGGEPATWMEIYPEVADPAAFEATLSELEQAHRLDQLLAPDGRRHRERFLPCA